MKKKEIVSITSIDDRDMTRAVIARADEAISELETRLSAENTRMTSAVQELGSIPGDRQRRSAEWGKANQTVTELTERIGHATALSRLYEGTPEARVHADDVTQLTTELEQAQVILTQTEETVRTQDTAQAKRESELHKLVEQLNPLVANLHAELKHMKAAREHARRKLAEQEHAATLQAYDDHNKMVATKEAELAEAKHNRQVFAQENINKFAEWRDLNADIRAKLLLEDVQTRQLEGYITFLEGFLKDRLVLTRQLPVDTRLLAPSHLDNWTHLFSFDAVEWFYSDWRRADLEPKEHQARLDILRDVLTRYRQWLAKG